MGLVYRRGSCIADRRSDWSMILTYVSGKTSMGSPHIRLAMFYSHFFFLVKEEANKEIIFRWNDGYRDNNNLDWLPESCYGAVS